MLRDIAFLVLLFLVIRFIRNLFTPLKVANNNFQPQAGASSNYYSSKDEGRVEVKDVPDSKSNPHHRHDKDGEYIDYKEL